MPARRRRTWALVLSTLFVVHRGLSAHRLDEYLQAARIAIEPDRVNVELDLTPGVAVAQRVVAGIDRDGDGSLSADEQRQYAARVLEELVLEVDGRTLRLKPPAISVSSLEELRHGEAGIHLESGVELPALPAGHHELLFRNVHDPDISVYLANALVPDSDRVDITAQRRDRDQRELTIEFVTRPAASPSRRAWVLGSLVGALAWAGFLTRRTARR